MGALVLLAAGASTRFGGPKQLFPVGPHGETILDYNAYDGAAAGFTPVIVVTSRALAGDVRQVVDRGAGRQVDCRIVLQEIPTGRTKPLGTVDAVLAAAEYLDTPFAVANADDLYGPRSFALLRTHLQDAGDSEAAIVGYRLDHTVPATGTVSRALIAHDPELRVHNIVEVHEIERTSSGFHPPAVDGFGPVMGEAPVSLNLWGFPPQVLAHFAMARDQFLTAPHRDGDGEIYLPVVVGQLAAAGLLRVRLLESDEAWSGLTNPEDADAARAHAAGRWPSPLWD